jgi:hypothetical protein
MSSSSEAAAEMAEETNTAGRLRRLSLHTGTAVLARRTAV